MYKQALSTLCTQDPAARSWSDRTDELFAGYCLDVHNDKPSECPSAEEYIYSAAWQVWHASDGNPCWSKLDVQEWLDRIIDPLQCDEALRCHAVISLHAFYCFLVKHGHLSRPEALPVVDKLMPLWKKAAHEWLDGLFGATGPEPQDTPAARPN